MCNSYQTCRQCRIDAIRNDVCDVWIARNPKAAEQIIMGWSEAYPIKTNGMKFQEVFGTDIKWENIEDTEAWLNAEYKGEHDE